MLAEVVRSGLVEARHDVVAAVVDAEGAIVYSFGDVDEPFYGRSSLKPFQARVTLEFGADLAGETLAIACASHVAAPEHLAAVRSVLATAGVDESALGTPPAVPGSPRAIAAASTDGRIEPRPVFHNCSGKHAAFLAAAVASDFDLGSYLSEDHPLQVAVTDRLVSMVGAPPAPAGVDGCGLPAPVVTATGLAHMFATLAVDDGYHSIRAAMNDHPWLIGDVGRPDGLLSAAGLLSKHGAEGCIGVAIPSLGVGLAVKAWDGSQRPIGPTVAALLERLGVLTDDLAAGLAVDVLGSGRPVGTVRAPSVS